jgi:hypothetical protein
MDTSSMSSGSAVAAILLIAGTLGHAQLSCPATVRVTDKVEAPQGWTAQAASKQAAFERISVFNASPAGDEYDLAPSSSAQGKGGEVTQVWKLADYRQMKLLLRCHYRDTESTLTIELPSPLRTCTFHFQLDAKGKFIGRSQVACTEK